MALLDMQGMELETRPGGRDGEWFSAVSLLLCDSAFSYYLCL